MYSQSWHGLTPIASPGDLASPIGIRCDQFGVVYTVWNYEIGTFDLALELYLGKE